MFARRFAQTAQASFRAGRSVMPRAGRFAPALIVSAGVFTYAATSLPSFSIEFPLKAACATIPMVGIPGTDNERTFIAVKPDGVNRGIIGNIISRFETKGFKLVAMKLIWPTKEMAEGHYADLNKRPFFGGLVKFFSSGPVCAMVWEGKGAVKTGRVMLGETNPAASLPGSIRGDLCIEVGRNICHGSDSNESAAHEIAFWFKPNEVYSYQKAEEKWVYGVN
eukprot:gb/GEZN01017556.1/.p1 GENE.gb/GEZN01017556.1/~~gb/GEZN01017556.1/.p1  ORF type:complete len:222 (-),score=42.69 gb/GEZN01017556.1/:102-767(-)